MTGVRAGEGWFTMSGKMDKAKGTIKQVVGKVTDNKQLETEGRVERRVGEAKEKVGHLADKVEKTAQRAERRAVEVLDKAKGAAHKK